MTKIRTLAQLILALALAGCGHSLAERESADDASCRANVAQRPNPQPGAYEMCRQSLLSYRRDRAIIVGGQ